MFFILIKRETAKLNPFLKTSNEEKKACTFHGNIRVACARCADKSVLVIIFNHVHKTSIDFERCLFTETDEPH